MRRLNRRTFVQATAAGAMLAAQARAQESPGRALLWHDVSEWGVEGKGWDDTTKFYDRLPAKAEQSVRSAVWSLSRHSAGMLARFRTDATQISIDYQVTSARLAMSHMPATGVSGVDLYAEDERGQWRWLAVTRPAAQTTRGELISGLRRGARNYAAYLPLYNGTEYLKIGVPRQAMFEPIKPRKEKPIVFYGTSITHGACASRPGMPHPAILGRRLGLPVINLGFSGNGKMEPEVGALLCELDAAAFVIDCLPNMVEAEVAERALPLVKQLRVAHPKTPILLVEDRTYANAAFLPSRQERHAGSRAALRQAYDLLLKEGTTDLAYLPGGKLLGRDRDDTTDGSHPSDLGFYRQARAMEPFLRELLQLPAA